MLKPSQYNFPRKMKTVTAAIIFKSETVLLARRKPGENLEGYWEFPGGKIECKETPQECLERELLEEFGIESKAGKIIAESIYNYDSGSIKLLGMLTKIDSQEIGLAVHDKIEWVPINNLLQYKLAPADVSIAKQIMERSYV